MLPFAQRMTFSPWSSRRRWTRAPSGPSHRHSVHGESGAPNRISMSSLNRSSHFRQPVTTADAPSFTWKRSRPPQRGHGPDHSVPVRLSVMFCPRRADRMSVSVCGWGCVISPRLTLSLRVTRLASEWWEGVASTPHRDAMTRAGHERIARSGSPRRSRIQRSRRHAVTWKPADALPKPQAFP